MGQGKRAQDLVLHFSDDAVKGALPARNALVSRTRCARIRSGQANGLVCGKLDRLARALTTQEAVLAQVWRPRAGGRASPAASSLPT